MRPLEGLRVVDLTRVLSGPFCTMQLGDLGAEVIKVERPVEGDDTRAFAPPYQGDEAAYFLSVNRNKKSITLDMKSERGREVLWRLIDRSDVLVENFRPGAMDRLGFGYAAVSARRPALVYCSISGFGNTGLQKDRPGYDVIVQGEAGIQDLTGAADGAPYKVGTSVADLVAGLNGSQAILAALYAAKTPGAASTLPYRCTKRSRRCSPSMPASTTRPACRRSAAGMRMRPSFPTRLSRRAMAGSASALPTTNCGSVSAGAVERPELTDDPRFAKAADRVRNRDILVPIVKDIIRQRPRRMAAVDGRRRDSERRRSGPSAKSARARAEVARDDRRDAACQKTAGIVKTIKNPMHLGGTPLDIYVAPPRLGEHTREVLTGLLGYSASEVDEMARSETI